MNLIMIYFFFLKHQNISASLFYEIKTTIFFLKQTFIKHLFFSLVETMAEVAHLIVKFVLHQTDRDPASGYIILCFAIIGTFVLEHLVEIES